MTEQPCNASDLSPGYAFPATLLAIAGHDRRQPVQIITSANEVLARSLRDNDQWEDLAPTERATAQLAAMLEQLVEAVQLDELSSDEKRLPVTLGPIFEELAREFAVAADQLGNRLREVCGCLRRSADRDGSRGGRPHIRFGQGGMDHAGKLIPSHGDCADQVAVCGECLSERRDLGLQAILLDDPVRPRPAPCACLY